MDCKKEANLQKAELVFYFHPEESAKAAVFPTVLLESNLTDAVKIGENKKLPPSIREYLLGRRIYAIAQDISFKPSTVDEQKWIDKIFELVFIARNKKLPIDMREAAWAVAIHHGSKGCDSEGLLKTFKDPNVPDETKRTILENFGDRYKSEIWAAIRIALDKEIPLFLREIIGNKAISGITGFNLTEIPYEILCVMEEDEGLPESVRENAGKEKEGKAVSNSGAGRYNHIKIAEIVRDEELLVNTRLEVIRNMYIGSTGGWIWKNIQIVMEMERDENLPIELREAAKTKLVEKAKEIGKEMKPGNIRDLEDGRRKYNEVISNIRKGKKGINVRLRRVKTS